VTIPTPESADAVRRAMHAAQAGGALLLGVVENMAGPPHAGNAGAELAAEFAVPLLAHIPWHPTAEAWQAVAARL
jgi:Mrp family chromosome partitioning ATPase